MIGENKVADCARRASEFAEENERKERRYGIEFQEGAEGAQRKKG